MPPSFFIEIPYVVKFKTSEKMKLDNEVVKQKQALTEWDNVLHIYLILQVH